MSYMAEMENYEGEPEDDEEEQDDENLPEDEIEIGEGAGSNQEIVNQKPEHEDQGIGIELNNKQPTGEDPEEVIQEKTAVEFTSPQEQFTLAEQSQKIPEAGDNNEGKKDQVFTEPLNEGKDKNPFDAKGESNPFEVVAEHRPSTETNPIQEPDGEAKNLITLHDPEVKTSTETHQDGGNWNNNDNTTQSKPVQVFLLR